MQTMQYDDTITAQSSTHFSTNIIAMVFNSLIEVVIAVYSRCMR